MSRPKTISDDEVLRIACDVFREHGHTVSTREIAQAAGISEAILYQRFGSKDGLFFAAMHARGPDVEQLLGPEDPADDARNTCVRCSVGSESISPRSSRLACEC